MNTAIFVASHIYYDNQLDLLNTCLISLVNQTKQSDIFVSISFESNKMIFRCYLRIVKLDILVIECKQYLYKYNKTNPHSICATLKSGDRTIRQKLQIMESLHYSMVANIIKKYGM